MSKHNKYPPQGQPEPLQKPLSPPPSAPVVDDDDEPELDLNAAAEATNADDYVMVEGLQTTDPVVIAKVAEMADHNTKALEEMSRSLPGMQTRPARYIAMTGLIYTNRAGVRRQVAISEAVDDLNREDLDGYLQRGHVALDTEDE
ncbi:MAG: hypothetical protein WC563_15550 [Brevundimonas sp.]